MANIESQSELLIGIDIGGTFTDFVVYDSNTQQISSHKILSTPWAPEEAVIQGLAKIITEHGANPTSIKAVFHGSTVATNALLERKGARTALITTAGFKDILEIGRQNRPELYDLASPVREPLIPAEARLEVEERLDREGNILRPMSVEINQLDTYLRQLEAESVAICLLFSFINPEHEKALGSQLMQEDRFVCLSSEVLPEFREYERTSTTVINAYVTPVLKRYLQQLETHLGRTKFYVMQSNGGTISAREASREGVRCILSGPAGGVAAATYLHQRADDFGQLSEKGLITLDMGGTSTDVSLIKGTPGLTREAQIDGYPIAISMLDIHTIGSGGGSLAAVDSGGALIVGPQSAGADPGPACYGKGSLPTVTDANLVLGRILPDHFLGGTMPLYPQRAYQAIEKLALELAMPVEVCAAGIVEIANTHMAKALRVISIERGEDPADFIMISFGGAGGLHAVELARLVGIPRVLIPQSAAVFSAFGMLVADTVKNYSHTVMTTAGMGYSWFKKAIEPQIAQAWKELRAEGIQPDQSIIQPELDMRYRGQSYEISIPLTADYISAFHHAHHQAYGYHLQGHPVEIVNLRVHAFGKKPVKIQLSSPKTAEKTIADALLSSHPVIQIDTGRSFNYSEIQEAPVPFYLAEKLPEQVAFPGPAVIVRPDTTIYISQQDEVQVDDLRNIIITLEK